MLDGLKPLGRSAGGRADELVRRLEDLVSDLGDAPSVRLGSKDDLCRTFQVAPGTMNEAIRVLENRGVIELRRGPQGGVFTASPSIYLRLGNSFLKLRGTAGSVEQCLAVRNHLEALLIVEAARAAPDKPEGIAELRKILAAMEIVIDDPPESLRLNWELHRHIAKLGSNGVLSAIYLTLLDYIEQEVTEVSPPRSRELDLRIFVMHRELVEAIASGDPHKAADAAKRHPLPAEDEAAGAPGTQHFPYVQRVT